MSRQAASASRQLARAPLVRPAQIRSISASAARRAGHGHDDHHGSDSSADTHESEFGLTGVYMKVGKGNRDAFFSPAIRNTLILTALLTLAYPYLPSTPKGSASPSASPSAFSSTATSPDAPFITRLLAKYTPDAKLWTERNDRHLELTKDKAEERLLFQEAERPRVWRMRYAS